MERTIYLETRSGYARMVVLEDGAPVELAFEAEGERGLVGNLYAARVMNVLPGLKAAFVDIGVGKNAFLPLDDLPAAMTGLDGPQKLPERRLRPGDAALVQVVREGSGDKGPRVTMNPSFPGKWAVLLPTVPFTGVSRRIQGEPREALLSAARAACPEGMGLVVRTAAQDAPEGAVAGEAVALAAAWEALSRKAAATKPPALVWDGGDMALRARRDLAASIVRGPLPSGTEARLRKALRRKVWLDCGGFLVFDFCEAMTVVDVNSGKFQGGKSHGDSVTRLNREAAGEIARQIRLRDLGGIIVIDFVDMDNEDDRQSVLEAFGEAMAPDRAKRHIHGFSPAGLLELTRRSVRRPVGEALYSPCPRCRGMGRVPRGDMAPWAEEGEGSDTPPGREARDSARPGEGGET